MELFKTTFDLHCLRVTAATIWFEVGVPLSIIQDFITGHATVTMLLHYVKVRNASGVLRDSFQKLLDLGKQIERELQEDIDGTLERFSLGSLVKRPEDQGLDGVAALRETAGVERRVFHYGICPTGSCPNGLDGRCGLCPLLISGLAFKGGRGGVQQEGGNELVISPDVEGDDKLISLLAEKEAHFMDLVRKGVPPAPDESQSTASTLQALYPENNGQIIELPGSAVEWDRELQRIKEQLKELTSKRDQIENALKEVLKEASAGTLPGGYVIYTYKSFIRQGYAVEGHSFRQLRRQLTKGAASHPAKLFKKRTELSETVATLVDNPSSAFPAKEPSDSAWYF